VGDAVGHTIGLVVHPHNPVQESVDVITEVARERGATVIAVEADSGRAGTGVEPVSTEAFVERADVVISLGGDGTMLGAMRMLAGRSTPVLGVNHGNLGFLVETPPAGLRSALERMARGEYTLEPHTCLQLDVDGATVSRKGEVAFNDVVVTADRPLTPITVDLGINGSERVGFYRCDAVVACTPTGSTAYNYASGGPIISPTHPCIAVTPVAPMSGIARTIIFGDDEVVLVVPAESPSVRFALDGALSDLVPPPATLTLRLCPDPVNVMRLDIQAYARRASVKLSLLDLPLRPDQLIELFPPQLRERAIQLGKTAPDTVMGEE
jgi:NAD+ kinase